MEAPVPAAAAAAAAPRPKLHGYAWFRAMGSPRFVMAPMVDQSELAFRMLAREYNTHLCYSPMMHSRLFSEGGAYRADNWEPCAADRPLVAQFCANDPATLLSAARHVETTCDAVDINLGCPQGIARKGRYGAFLLTETRLLVDMVSLLHAELAVPVTVKIRLLPRFEDSLALCRALEGAGASLITVHGRLKEQNKTATGFTDWEAIRRIKAAVAVPVFANGGIGCLADAEACLAYTGADGVMSSEALLENPALFAQRLPAPVLRSGAHSAAAAAAAALPADPGSLPLPPRARSARAADLIADGLAAARATVTAAPLDAVEAAASLAAGVAPPGAVTDLGEGPQWVCRGTEQLALATRYLALCEPYTPRSLKCIRAHLFKMLFASLQAHPDIREALSDAEDLASFNRVVAALGARLASASAGPPPEGWMLHPEHRGPIGAWYGRYRKQRGAGAGAGAGADEDYDEASACCPARPPAAGGAPSLAERAAAVASAWGAGPKSAIECGDDGAVSLLFSE
jgi:tRNA-dihydrouridine synthase